MLHCYRRFVDVGGGPTMMTNNENNPMNPTGPLVSVFYVSSATQPMSDDGLADLLRVARARNRHRHITGVLLYKNDSFAQVIEGPEPAIDELLEKLKADPRHTNVTALLRDQINQRRFDQWAMGYATTDAVPDDVAQWFLPYLDDPQSLEQMIRSDHDNARLMLGTFIDMLDAKSAAA